MRSFISGFVSFQKGEPETDSFEYFESVHDAINSLSEVGWEQMEDVKSECLFVVDTSTNQIAAVGMYIDSNESKLPILQWTVTETGENFTRTYEIEYKEYLKKPLISES